MLIVLCGQNLGRMVETFVPDTGSTVYIKAIKDMMLDGNPSFGVNHIQNYKVQVITKQMLLQRVAATLGCPVLAVEDGSQHVAQASSFNHHKNYVSARWSNKLATCFQCNQESSPHFSGPGQGIHP